MINIISIKQPAVQLRTAGCFCLIIILFVSNGEGERGHLINFSMPRI